MSNASMTPGSRPRKGVIAALGGVAALAAVAGLVVAGDDLASRVPGSPFDPPAAGAAELRTFPSCAAMADWATTAARSEGGPVGTERTIDEDVVAAAPSEAPTTAAAAEGSAADDGAGARAGATGATNVAVEGVDEIDLVDRIDEDRVLVATGGTLTLVDLATHEVLSAHPIPGGAEITHDAERSVVWAVGDDAQGSAVVERIGLVDDDLEGQGRWTTSGSVVDARRVDGELHLVATDGFGWAEPRPGPRPEPGMPWTGPQPAASAPAVDTLPFGDEAVPCDEVLHVEGPGAPSATLVATFPATGAVAPVRSAEVVGSGQGVHLTPEAAYITTPTWDDAGAITGIHRFDLATLTATGSGIVDGTLLDDFALSEHDGALRVATTVAPSAVPSVAPRPEQGARDVVAPPPDGGALNEVVVLDTDGALEEIGRTERFGKPGETIHGIRFAGTTGYAVTFLETDPFYVIDLADPTAPAVVGEVELPGFSAYLHPLDDDTVVGFGPGADGRASAKLFDVSDPTAPAVVDDLTLGDEAPVVWDHHAFVALDDGRFAVPATTWSDGPPRSAVVVVDSAGGRLTVDQRWGTSIDGTAMRALPTPDGWALLTGTDLVILSGDEQVAGTVPLAR